MFQVTQTVYICQYNSRSISSMFYEGSGVFTGIQGNVSKGNEVGVEDRSWLDKRQTYQNEKDLNGYLPSMVYTRKNNRKKRVNRITKTPSGYNNVHNAQTRKNYVPHKITYLLGQIIR